MNFLIENKNWSSEDNENIYYIILGFGLSQQEEQILNSQIQQFNNAEQFTDLLLKSQGDWNYLQDSINQYIKMQVKQTFNNNDNQVDLQKQLEEQILSKESIPKIIQFIQQNKCPQDLVQNILQLGVESFNEFVELFDVFSQKSYISQSSTKQKPCVKQNQQDEIDLMFQEFQLLNSKMNEETFHLIQQVYYNLQIENQIESGVKFSTSPKLELEDLILLCQGVKNEFAYYPRPVQLLSIIELFNHQYNKGRLAQIYTGEGKTLIVAMLAILISKKKKLNVDIITSSRVLAIRDAQELAQFYKYFHVQMNHNINTITNIKEGMLPCYQNEVIYGDSHSFQADILRDEYSELGTMGNRKQGYIIIDEVDSMLIDGTSNKTLLSSSIPGMLDLTKVLKLIWDEICKIEPNVSTDQKVMITNQDKMYSIDLEEYLEQTLNLQLEEAVQAYIPKFRLNYIHFIKKTWIKNALRAKYYFKPNIHYVIINNNIRIVDYQNTGVIHNENMQWEQGLHQFIQLKHNFRVTPMRISTNFISNVSFFLRYQEKLLGLTGTLGSQSTQQLLAKKYKVDFVFIPPHKQRLLKEVEGHALLSEDEWLLEIQKAVQQQMANNRAVLLINQTITEVNKIFKTLNQQYQNIIKYTDDSQNITKEIGTNTIIIATNLAGRGTDLRTNEQLEKNGGLHVIMTFLPRNIRIQQQGFGRSGRQGNKGTAQLIVYFSNNLHLSPEQTQIKAFNIIEYYEKFEKKRPYTNLDILIFFRNQNEQYCINEIESQMEKLLNEDSCFQRFCQIAKSKANIKKSPGKFKSLEEKWGLYLEQNKDFLLNKHEIEYHLNLDDGTNPKYLILQGLEQENLDILNQATQIQEFDPQAQYYKGIYEIKNKQYQQGLQTLVNAKQLFQNKINDEKGFATATKLNKVQIQQFQETNDNFQGEQSQINFPNMNLELPDIDFFHIEDVQNISAVQFLDKPTEIIDVIDEKINNQIQVYEKVIDNIDDIVNTVQHFNPENEEIEISWQPVIDQSDLVDENLKPIIEDQKEVIQDGPLPKLGRITKKPKERNWWEYVAMFTIGLCQFVVGCAICAFTCGAALPLGKAFIQEGISDMVYAVTAAWKGIDIDWGAWGQRKVITIASALALAGPVGIQEALQIGGKAMKSLKSLGLTEFLSKIPQVTTEGLKKAGFWLSDLEKLNINNQYETLQRVSNVADFAKSNNEILKLVSEILDSSIAQGIISNSIGNDIQEIILKTLENSNGNADGWKNSFCEIAKKYIRTQMTNGKSNKQDIDSVDDLKQICIREGNSKFDNVQNEIKNFKLYEQRLNNELNQFSNYFWDCFKQDKELQNIILILDIFASTDKLLTKENYSSSKLQTILNHSLNIHNDKCKKACIQLQMTNQQSMNSFYNEILRPTIYKLCQRYFSQIQSKEPLELILGCQIKFLYEAEVNSIQKFKVTLDQQLENLNLKKAVISNKPAFEQEKLHKEVHDYNNQVAMFIKQKELIKEFEFFKDSIILKQVIEYLLNKKMINRENLAFSNQCINEVKIFANQQHFNQKQTEILVEAIQNLLNVVKNEQKLFTQKLRASIQAEILDALKRQIFELKMKAEDKKILNKIDK